MSKLADYGIVLLLVAARSWQERHSAKELARQTRLPLPTVTKLLKALTRSGLLVSTRGALGGYRLARAPASINVVEVISAVDGPPAMTQCTDPNANACEREQTCPTAANWRVIHRRVLEALAGLSLADMARQPDGDGVSFGSDRAHLPLEGLARRVSA
jgi:FeS assembly SUF system regulator